MRKNVLLGLAFLFFSFNLFAQAQLNAFAKVFTHQYKTIKDDSFLFPKLIKDYDLIKINDVYHIGVLAIVNQKKLDETKFEKLGIINDTRLQQLWSMRVPVGVFNDLINLQGIEYVEIGEPVSPFLELAVPSARVDSVNSGLGELLQAYTGKDVIVAVIDWGFDYTHPNFYDTSLNHYRIVRAWDQNKLSGPSPEGYSFGTEHIGQEELLEVGCDTLYLFGLSSHGTHVAGIAGGAGAGTPHRGAAFDADLIFISLRRDAPSLIDAFAYITDYAESVGKPYVVNMSFGSHLGPHDGTSLKNMGIDNLHGPGRIFVGSAGNNGESDYNGRFHLDKDFSENQGDTLKTVVEFWNIPDMFGQTLSMWGSEFSDFSVSLALVNASNDITYQTPFYSSINEPLINDTILIGEDSLIIRIQSVAQHYLNNKPNIRLEVKKTSGSRLVLKATSENSHLHIWNNVRMNNRYTNWGAHLRGNYPGAVDGDNNYGLGEPAGVGKNVITVGSYRAERIIEGSTYTMYGKASPWSSMGPTVDERTKPDISSAGEVVASSVNSFNHTEEGFAAYVEFNDSIYFFKSYSGTSMSGPLVAGIVALMLEAYPDMSATQAKEILKTTARLDEHTGNIGAEGDLKWGWGKANALAAVRAAEIYANTEDIKISDAGFNMYPNPANEIINITGTNKDSQITGIEIFSVDGKISKKIPGSLSSNISINISDLPEGIYIVKVQTTKEFSFKHLIITR